ncbi:S8 family serine peptidase [Dokdonella sp.]|uniref:S8 family serine peptidase n=1 Tax=Dokdonella sp. TaxID=2291710 RepID=UPI0031C55D18|nr:S8 family serine peptidase [Dokdonella sp.]
MNRKPVRTALAAALALALASGAACAASPTTLAAALPSPAAIDAARGNPDVLILRAGVFDPLSEVIEAQQVGAAAPVKLSSYAIVQFKDATQMAHARRALTVQGVAFLNYLPNNAWYVRLGQGGLGTLRSDPAVRWADFLQPALKLDPQLWIAQREASTALQADGRYEIRIDAFAGVSSAAMAAELEKKVPGVEITVRSARAEALPYVRAATGPASLDTLLKVASGIEGVVSVSPWTPTTTQNSASVGAIQGNSTGNCAGSGAICGPAPLWDHGITGTGQIAAVADSGTTPNAAWFTQLDKGAGPHTAVTFSENPPPVLPDIGTLYQDNKIIAYWLQPGGPIDYDYSSGHGTHVTGTVLGDAAGTFGGNTYLPASPLLPNHDLADGMAPGAQLLFQDAGPASASSIIINDFGGTLQQAFNGGARVHNNSWGAKTGGRYEGNDSELDRTTWANEDLLVVVAAGNDVAGTMATGSPANAKNSLAVAALGHGGSLVRASYSNRGPTRDGRFKPDIAAPGSSIISARNSGTVNGTINAPATTGMSGTSMASPTITGNAVLARQFFADGFYPRGERVAADAYDPTGAAVKAVLLNGTNTISTSWPNDGTGWGRAWLDGNLWFNDTLPGGDDSRRLRLFERPNAAGLKTGQVNEYFIDNVQAGVELRATLVWFDPNAVPGAASTLINNLDLEVVGPGATTYFGNVFSNGVSTPGGSADAKNTVEAVRFDTPAAGSYTFRVKATSVPGNGTEGSDAQGYALAVSGGFALPDPTPFPAPTGVSASSNGAAGVAVGFSAAAGAQAFQLYRARGSCAFTPPGAFRMVANGAASPLVDDSTIGGFMYAYKVRGVHEDVEGEVSNCVDVISDDVCTLMPSLEVSSLMANGAASECSVELAWDAAQANCPTSTGISYQVERDSDPYFGAPVVVASALAAPAFIDVDVTDGTPYYYRVRAVDSFGNASPVSRVANVTPSGIDGPDPARFLDDVDTHTYMNLQAPWQITDSNASNGAFSYRNAADDQPYPNATCASITTPPLTLAPDTHLNFKAMYNLEYQWDGVVMEISTDGGATWLDLAPDGGYPSDFGQTMNPPINACGFAASHGAFSGVSTASSNADPGNDTATAVFKPFAADLSSYAGQTVQIRWRMSTDPASGYLGFLLDEVSIGDGSVPSTDVIFANGFDAAGPGGYICTVND